MAKAQNGGRVVVDPKIMVGKPVIKGTRIPVYLILELLEAGQTIKQITDDYPELSEEDVKAAIHYAETLMKREIA
jgi:uncharacterized protein (DUF433 family)